MIARAVVVMLAIVATGMPAGAQTPNPIVGTWHVVSFEHEDVATKAVSQVFGGHAMGFVTYTPDGRMMEIVVDAMRKPPARPTATDAEALGLYRTMFAYAGTYDVRGNEIIQHVEISSEQTLTGTDQTRYFKLDGGRLTTMTPPGVRGLTNNQSVVTTVVWERVK